MSLEDLGNIGEFVAAVAVVVSLIYLASQIRQNSKTMRAATEQSILQGITTALTVTTYSSENANLFQKGLSEPGELSESELTHFFRMLATIFAQHENAYLSYTDGTLPKRRWERQMNVVRFYLSQPGGRDWWERSGTHFLTDEFKAHIEEAAGGPDSPAGGPPPQE